MNLLIGHDPRTGDVVVTFLVRQEKLIDSYTRINYGRIPPVGFTDSASDVIRYRHEMIDAVRRSGVPDSAFVQHPTRKQRSCPCVKIGFAEVLMLEIPRVSHWSVAVA